MEDLHGNFQRKIRKTGKKINLDWTTTEKNANRE